jgi:hypothetical protein
MMPLCHRAAANQSLERVAPASEGPAAPRTLPRTGLLDWISRRRSYATHAGRHSPLFRRLVRAEGLFG